MMSKYCIKASSIKSLFHKRIGFVRFDEIIGFVFSGVNFIRQSVFFLSIGGV